MTRPSESLVVGVDGGATRSRYLLTELDGRVRARREGPAALLTAGEDERVARRIADEIRALVESGGASIPVAAICAGLAGAAGRPAAAEAVRSLLAGRSLADRVEVTSDADIAFLDAFGSGPGILLVAGTGSIALARTRDGTWMRVGGWGARIGDEGSGYRIGIEAVRAAVRSAEGRGLPTSLRDRIFDAVGVGSVDELYLWSCGVEKGSFAALAPLVIEEAVGEDYVAERIVGEAVTALVKHAQALVDRGGLAAGLEGPPPDVALVGGLVEPGGSLRARLVGALGGIGLRLAEREVEPVRGAACRAASLV